MKDEKSPVEDAVWRYGIVSPLLHRDSDQEPLWVLLERLARQTYVRPDGSPVNYSPETLRKWFYRFNHGGLPALENRQRSDKGKVQIPAPLVEALISVRRDNPEWTLARVLQQLIEDGKWNGRKPGRSTLYRFAAERNLTRGGQPSPASSRAFAFASFGQLWSADFLHGPKVRVGRRLRKSYLHLIIDDCTRYVINSGFYTAESTEVLFRELMTAVGRFGIPQRFYTDNGPCYASRHLKLVCGRLGMQLVHTPPYRPQGRGKVERIFRTVRDQMLRGGGFGSLEALNKGLRQWMTRYHERRHSSLGCSPLEKRLAVDNCCRPLPEVADIDALFRMERNCRVYRDTTVRLFNRRFEVPGCTPGSRVTVYFMPWDKSHIYYGDEARPAYPLDMVANARRYQRP